MVLNIISFFCVILVSISIGIFIYFILGHLKEIKTKIDSIPKKYWGMTVCMDDIPQNEQNILNLSSVPLKIYEKGEYSDLLVPHIGEEVGGIYYSGQHKFSMEGIVTNVYYNTDFRIYITVYQRLA